MANTSTLKKVSEYLEKNQGISTPSDIVRKANLKWKSVKECLEILREANQISVLSNGKTTFIKLNPAIIQNATNTTS